MRRLFITAIGLVAAALAGCKNSTTGQITNPFLTPDRVPPPSTRVLAPGTAAPYYPGDPAPGAILPGAAPAVGTPAFGAPTYGPGTTLPTTSGLPATSPPLTTPPNGWGTYPPQSSATPGGEAVGVPGDDHQLRFAGGTPPATSTASTASSFAPASASALSLGPAADARLPIQSILPLAADQPAPQQLAAREVTPAEYLAGGAFTPGASLASAEATRDGFRPQGSQPRVERESDSSFRPPEIRREGPAGSQDDAVQYGVGANHAWIRGQLEYWPESGAWSIRHVPAGGPVDAAGGRVTIANPQVLANLSPGELVMVQGQLFAQSTEAGAVQPAYRVAAVQRQRY